MIYNKNSIIWLVSRRANGLLTKLTPAILRSRYEIHYFRGKMFCFFVVVLLFCFAVVAVVVAAAGICTGLIER